MLFDLQVCLLLLLYFAHGWYQKLLMQVPKSLNVGSSCPIRLSVGGASLQRRVGHPESLAGRDSVTVAHARLPRLDSFAID